MKHFKKIALLLMAVVFLTVLPAGNVLKASAAEPTKYLVSYTEDDRWEYRVGADSWEDAAAQDHHELYYMLNDFKDGDILIIEGSKGLDLDLGQHRISNLTIRQGAGVIIVHAGSIDECSVLGGRSASITGTITNAYVYDDARVTFCSSIVNLNLLGVNGDVSATAYCHGTVAHVLAQDGVAGVRYEIYDVAEGRLEVDEDGRLLTKGEYYSTTPSASTQQAPQSPASQSSNQTSNASNASNAYDKVPKTGDSIPVSLIFAGISAICFAGRVALKRA